ncbi:hypothetical protein VSDG_01172 [Cytospora chrysosperma]|uniref:Uncharacterized protein n=1 Tax=Cytospora chrysosperma TaxID=252740 RepID=A0A423WLP2_CYTCH|nr:hypothetical protein VSDG_01172 [Valsa sordida]
MPADVRRVSFREDKSRSGSSRSSTLKSESGAGSSSTGSSYSGTHHTDRYNADPLYEVHALRQALADAVKNADSLKAKAYDEEQTLRKDLEGAKSRVKALENHCAAIKDDNTQLQEEKMKLRDEVKSLKAQNATLQSENEKLKKKTEKQPTTASSTEAGKPHRSESRRSKESDSDKEKSRLKERFVPRNENTSESTSSKRSSSRAPRSRRMSTASYPERPVYVEPFGPGAARSSNTSTSPVTTGGRRLDGYIATSKTGYPAISTIQDPVYSSTPRSIDRPSVLYSYTEAPISPSMSYEDGNYHAHPLPPRR